MTLFVKAAKELIIRILEKNMMDSSSKDSGSYGFLRDTELSKQQIKITTALQKEIETLGEKESDEASLTALKELIRKADGTIEQLRSKKRQERGTLNGTLINIIANLERFYHNMIGKEFSFINMPDEEEDPFNLLCGHALYYFGEHIMCPPEETLVSRAASSVAGKLSGSSSIEIRGQKEACLLRHLTECKKTVDILDRDSADYLSVRKRVVTEKIELILSENETICERVKPIDSLPVSLSLFSTVHVKAPNIKPSRGRLKEVLENALRKIASITVDEARLLAKGSTSTASLASAGSGSSTRSDESSALRRSPA